MPRRASPMATNTASAPRSASRPTSCTRADRSAWKASPRRSSWSSATGKCAARPAATMASRPRRILPVIVVSQFAGGSLWFAGNAVLADLALPPTALGYITSAVQVGFIAGALVLGTAFPHLLKALGQRLPWQAVTLGASATAVVGGLVMLAFVPDGPYLRQAAKFDPHAFALIFRRPAFRASSFGYFGHMWELYAFWTFVPVVLAAHGEPRISLWSFAVIAAGFIGCAA